jgi:hypothetical protein
MTLPVGAPAWLDPARQETRHDDPKMSPKDFTVASLRALRSSTQNVFRACEVVANSLNETGNGQHYAYWNLGGWKYTRDFANAHPNETYWTARGNIRSGDSPIVVYRVFPSLQAFYDAWMRTFVPRDGHGRYAETGRRFWADDPSWFAAMIEAGYKGPVTRAHPAGPIREHDSLSRTAALGLQAHFGITGPININALADCYRRL